MNASRSKSASRRLLSTCRQFVTNAGGDPARVVVRRDQAVGALDQVRAEQQPVAGVQGVGERAEEGRALLDVEVADGSAQEGDHAPAAPGRCPRCSVKSPTRASTCRLGYLLGELPRRGPEGLLGHVDRDEAGELAGRREGVEQDAGLVAGAAAELDQRRGAGGRDDVVGVPRQDGALPLGGVVLREPGDLVEQLGADVVVEPLRRQAARLGAQSSSHVLDQGVAGPVRVEDDRDHRWAGRVHDAAPGRPGVGAPPSARRTPDSAHRDWCGKKLRYVARA